MIVGSNDKFFTKEHIDKIRKYDFVNLNIIDNASHSLEIEDNYIKSLEILGIVTKLCASFVCKN
jgi:hypothetical protein